MIHFVNGKSEIVNRAQSSIRTERHLTEQGHIHEAVSLTLKTEKFFDQYSSVSWRSAAPSDQPLDPSVYRNSEATKNCLQQEQKQLRVLSKRTTETNTEDGRKSRERVEAKTSPDLLCPASTKVKRRQKVTLK